MVHQWQFLPQRSGDQWSRAAHITCIATLYANTTLHRKQKSHRHKFHVRKWKKKNTHQTHRIYSHFLWEWGGQRCLDSTGFEDSCWQLQCLPRPRRIGLWGWKKAYPGCVSALSGTGSTEGSWELSRSYLLHPLLDKREILPSLFYNKEQCHGIVSMTFSSKKLISSKILLLVHL